MDAGAFFKNLASESMFAVNSVRSRGAKHFGRPLIIGFLMVFFSYKMVYVSSGAALKNVQIDLTAARATAQYADTFRDLEDRLSIFSQRLPPSNSADSWLMDIVRESMKQEGIASNSLSPVQRSALGRFQLLTFSIQCRASYKQLGSWMARMERSPKLLHVARLEMTKDTKEIGMNEVTVTIASLLPVEGTGQ